MKNISIRTKLLVAFSALFLLIVAQGIFSIGRLSVVNDLTTVMEETLLPSTRHVGAMNITAARFRISEARHILNRVQFETRRFQFRSSPPWATLEGWYYGFQTGRGLNVRDLANGSAQEARAGSRKQHGARS